MCSVYLVLGLVLTVLIDSNITNFQPDNFRYTTLTTGKLQWVLYLTWGMRKPSWEDEKIISNN